MTNQKHTPGPWVLGMPETETSPQHILDRAGGIVVAYVNKQRGAGEANARLIAAAPELLEACYKSLANFEDLLLLHGGILDQELALNIHGVIKALTQAIAKAEGGAE